jgi:hypothetical protein
LLQGVWVSLFLNGGSMQLICSAKLSDTDITMIKMAVKNPEEIIQETALIGLGFLNLFFFEL